MSSASRLLNATADVDPDKSVYAITGQACTLWTCHLRDPLVEQINEYLTRLHDIAVQEGKSLGKNDKNSIYGFFQRNCVAVKDIAVTELDKRVECLERKVKNLHRVILMVLKLNFAVMSVSRANDLTKVQIDPIDTRDFVKQCYQWAAERVALRYPHWFDRSIEAGKRRECFHEARLAISQVITHVVIDNIPVQEISAKPVRRAATAGHAAHNVGPAAAAHHVGPAAASHSYHGSSKQQQHHHRPPLPHSSPRESLQQNNDSTPGSSSSSPARSTELHQAELDRMQRNVIVDKKVGDSNLGQHQPPKQQNPVRSSAKLLHSRPSHPGIGKQQRGKKLIAHRGALPLRRIGTQPARAGSAAVVPGGAEQQQQQQQGEGADVDDQQQQQEEEEIPLQDNRQRSVVNGGAQVPKEEVERHSSTPGKPKAATPQPVAVSNPNDAGAVKADPPQIMLMPSTLSDPTKPKTDQQQQPQGPDPHGIAAATQEGIKQGGDARRSSRTPDSVPGNSSTPLDSKSSALETDIQRSMLQVQKMLQDNPENDRDFDEQFHEVDPEVAAEPARLDRG